MQNIYSDTSPKTNSKTLCASSARSTFQTAVRSLGAFRPLHVRITREDIKLGRGGSKADNPVARAIAGHIKEELIAHAPCANGTGNVAIIAPAHFALPGFGISTSGYSEDTSDTDTFEFPLPDWVAERVCQYLRGSYIEPFDFQFALPEIFTVDIETYVPRIKMPCYPGAAKWTPKGAYQQGDLLSPLRKIH